MRVVLVIFALALSFSLNWGGTHPDGVSQVSREQDALGNYKFSYAVSNAEGEHFREEGTDHLGRVIGTYGLTHKDGTSRVVDYVADKDGFRAEVRSNEPGLASSETGDATILKLQPDIPLTAAATALDGSQSAFGTRLNSDNSRVSYIGQEENSPEQVRPGIGRDSRTRNFDDYRPRNPVAYYPDRPVDLPKPLNAPVYEATEGQRRPRTQNAGRLLSSSEDEPPNVQEKSKSQDPAVESRPLDIYLPPINPHSAIRRPPYFDPADRTLNRFTTTSRRPFTPPYGGFDDDPLPVGRRPGISMSTVHGGLGNDDFDSPQTSTPSYGAGRYPIGNIPLSRDFIRPQFPPVENSPRLPGSLLPPGNRRLPPGSSILPSGPERIPPGPFFDSPSYDRDRTPPKFVLRAVPIPNGIQAVRVDPETGRVYERIIYPLYFRQDGYPEYDRNVLLHNDDVTDDDGLRNDNPSYADFPYRRRLPFRSARTALNSFDEEFGNRSRAFNNSFIDPKTLSIPTARDLSWIQRQLSLVEGFDRTRFSNPSFFRNSGFENSEYPAFNDFDDVSAENVDNQDNPYSNNRNRDRSEIPRNYDRSEFSRNPRHYDRLQPEDTKAIIVSESKNTDSDSKTAETNPNPAVVKKE